MGSNPAPCSSANSLIDRSEVKIFPACDSRSLATESSPSGCMGRRPFSGLRQRTQQPRAESRAQGYRLFRAVLLAGDGMPLEFAGDVLDAQNRMPDFVGIEDVGCQRVTASMSHAAIRVNRDVSHRAATGNTSGSVSTDRSAAV